LFFEELVKDQFGTASKDPLNMEKVVEPHNRIKFTSESLVDSSAREHLCDGASQGQSFI